MVYDQSREARERAIDRALLCAAALSLIAGITIGLAGVFL